MVVETKGGEKVRDLVRKEYNLFWRGKESWDDSEKNGGAVIMAMAKLIARLPSVESAARSTDPSPANNHNSPTPVGDSNIGILVQFSGIGALLLKKHMSELSRLKSTLKDLMAELGTELESMRDCSQRLVSLLETNSEHRYGELEEACRRPPISVAEYLQWTEDIFSMYSNELWRKQQLVALFEDYSLGEQAITRAGLWSSSGAESFIDTDYVDDVKQRLELIQRFKSSQS